MSTVSESSLKRNDPFRQDGKAHGSIHGSHISHCTHTEHESKHKLGGPGDDEGTGPECMRTRVLPAAAGWSMLIASPRAILGAMVTRRVDHLDDNFYCEKNE